MTIGQTLRAIRKKKKMSVRWLAYYAQVHHVLIYNYEEGNKQPTVTNLLRLCRGLKVSLAAFNKCELYQPKEKVKKPTNENTDTSPVETTPIETTLREETSKTTQVTKATRTGWQKP